MANYNGEGCDELEAFSNIRYTPAWYYKKWPRFLNVESYKILAAWDRGVRTEEEWLSEQGLEEEKGEEQEMQCMIETDRAVEESQNMKRKQNSVYLEEGLEQPSL